MYKQIQVKDGPEKDNHSCVIGPRGPAHCHTGSDQGLCHGFGDTDLVLPSRQWVCGFVQIAWVYMAMVTTIETNAMFYVPGHKCVFETHNGHSLKVRKDSDEYECKGISVAWDAEHRDLKVKYTAGKQRNAKGFMRKGDGYKIGDGKNHIGEGTAEHYFYPTGDIKVEGEINGEAFQSQGVWNTVFFAGKREDAPAEASERDTFHILQYETPASFGSACCSNAGLTEAGNLKAVFWDTTVEHMDMVKDENGSGYSVPKRILFTSKGKTTDGKPVTVTFDAQPKTRLHDIDVLHEMPYVVRRLVQALITKPITVAIEGEQPYDLVGVAFNELTLMK
ncbi:Svf1-like-domain-containing protein [Kickxella alabastrina]|uniref:Svf1-like-domain-containing protein n=1 Tax=Kickxella alabastrina TaxID=61397 RepID=UPI002220102D|nr:Svf1-like-domain-containing protein [Kickxella alabastrina]KAI7826359.1 Svf1-like-domain-containing protein [Kickxella alabastrina]